MDKGSCSQTHPEEKKTCSSYRHIADGMTLIFYIIVHESEVDIP